MMSMITIIGSPKLMKSMNTVHPHDRSEPGPPVPDELERDDELERLLLELEWLPLELLPPPPARAKYRFCPIEISSCFIAQLYTESTTNLACDFIEIMLVVENRQRASCSSKKY